MLRSTETLPQTEKAHLPNTTKHETMKFFPLFLGDSSTEDFKLKPSVYLREMMLNTEERIEQLNKLTLKKIRSSFLFDGNDKKDFKISPPLILFQSFQPGKQYSATLTICNISEGSKLIGIKSKPTQTFSVSYLSKVTSKLAPGISLHFLVKFTPLSDQDYSDSLTLQTDSYTFDVFLAALGSRPLVNFPDSVDLKETLVKIPSKRTFYVKNIGQVPATFNIVCEKPFSVYPERYVLEVGKIIMITINFETDILDDFFKKMFVRFEAGEELCIDLSGSTRNGKVWLDSKHIYLDDTFMGLKRQQKVTLYNDTDVTVKFSWHKFGTQEHDVAEFERIKEGFDKVKVAETIRCTQLEYNDIITEDNHSNVYSRILKDQVDLLSPKDFYFQHNNFEINPVEGELWPGGRCAVAVTFSPHCVGQFCCTAYCDVAGVAHRLPLQMTGQGLGPVVQLNLRSLDIGPIFLGLTQAYEIVAANKGDILCRLEHVPTQPMFGGVLTVQPPSQCLMPYEMKSFIISFCSGRTGSFVEDVCFRIAQSNEVLSIMLKGSVVNPTISFDSAKLDFGCVAVGFPKTMSVGLVNQSQVPVEFALRVPSDGSQPPVTCELFAAASPKPALVSYCSEFTIEPDSGVIDPNTTLTIEVTLITNADRKHSCVMVAENKNSKLLESISLSLVYESRVAKLLCNPPELILRFSFINFEYCMDFTLTNTSTLPAYFYFPPQSNVPMNNILYTMDVIEALLQPNESITVNVKVVPVITGRVRQDIMVLLFGNPILTSVSSISCSVQGPNVSSNVVSLEYGKMTLMEPKTLSFELSNDSPISGAFIISIEERAQSKWTVEPLTGRLGPGESVTVNVTLQVLDPGTITTALSIQVENSRVISIGLFASASGCGITIEPNIFPEINLGYLFSRRLYQFVLTLYNPGSRHHFITFVQDRMSINSGPSYHLNLFKLNPNKFDLLGGGKAQVILEGQSNRDVDIVESYSCLAIINKRGVKQNLGNFLIRASFISPMVEVSEESLEFEINIGPGDKQGGTTFKSVTIKSVASLPITVVLELNPPFLILEDGARFCESVRELEPNQETEIVLGFNPPPQYNLVSIVYNENLLLSYKEHPQKDKVPLKGMLNFPNLDLSQNSLDFECIPLDTQEYKQIYMVNSTPLPVKFAFSFDPKSIVVVYFEQENVEDILGPELSEELKEKPFSQNSLLGTIENKESSVGPVPLLYVEPVANQQVLELHRDSLAVEKQEDSPLTEEELKEIHGMLFPLSQPYFSPERPTPEFNALLDNPLPKPDVSQVFDLSPMFGTIPPHQSQVLHVAFRPQPFMGVAATAVCSVVGGPTESVRLSGHSARHLFSISTTFINFGFRVFMEPCEETIKISNLSQLPFHFKVSSNPPLAPEVYDVQVGCLTVEPCFGNIPAQSCTSVTVRFYPGLSGEFQQQFNIQVGYLDPVNILVTGYGVVPQVAVNCPHVSRPKIPINWGYQAVASLTAKRFTHMAAAPFQSDLEALEDTDLDDWVLVTSGEKVPSAQDIWLALERVIAYNYIRENSLYFFKTGENNKKLFNQCFTPGYILDLGSVVLGTTTNITVLVENRGLVRCDVKLILPMAEKKLKHLGFSVSFQNHMGLPVGKSVPLDITIKPTTQKYLSKEEAVHFTFYLQVTSGANVPLYLKALFTVPYIIVDCTTMDFGSVQCGQCKKMCLLLRNSGAVKAEWSVNLVAIKRKKQGKVLPEELVRFSVNKTSGLFQPKTSELLEIGFMPKEERFYETTLRLEVKHNPEIVMVRLSGNGVEPKITVSPKTVQFGTHVPFSGPIESQFSITNPCSFSVQVYFPDFDRDIINEDRILRVFTNYYKSDTMLLPLETYDKVPSSELEEFYDKIKNEVSTTLKLREFRSKSFSSVNASSHSGDIPRARRSTKSSASKFSKGSVQNYLESIPDPFISLSPAEVEKHLLEVMNESDNGLQLPRDALGLDVRCTPRLVDETRDKNKGILNVFHGAPHTDYEYWANRTGRLLNHKVVTLDELILREAATSERAAAVVVQEAVSEAYLGRALDSESLELLTDGGSGVSFEELVERMNFLKSAKEPILAEEDTKKVGSKKSSASKPGSAKKAEVKKPPPATFSDIPVQTFIELLSDRLLEEVEKGVVLESLTGFFLKTINSAVNVILRIVGHISCLRFITLFGTYELYEQHKKDSFDKQERLQMREEREKLLELDRLTSDQLEQASPSDKLLHENYVVEERRRWLRELRARREEKARRASAESPQTTAKSRGGGKKSVDKSLIGSTAIKASKGKTNKDKEILSKTENTSSKAKKSPVNKLVDTSGDDLNLKEAFEKYETELQELVFLLSRWNRDIAEFEGLDKPSSLFNIKTQAKPQSRKGKDTSRNASDETGSKDKASLGVKMVIVFQNYRKIIPPDDAITYLRDHTSFRESENITRAWWDIKLPDPLILSSVCRPDHRVQNGKIQPLNIFDSKRRKNKESVLENAQSVDTKCATEHSGSIDLLKASQEDKERMEDYSSRSKSVDTQKTGSVRTAIIPKPTRKSENIVSEEIDLRNSSEDNISKKSLMSVEETSGSSNEKVFTSRVELAPGEERTWSVFFEPVDLGVFNQSIHLEVAGWRKRYRVMVEAECDIPHIDTHPAALFEKVHDSLSATTISQCVFLNDTKIFYFGPVFATAANAHRTNDQTTNFYFTNVSCVHCEMEFSFMSKKRSDGGIAFGFKPNTLDIPPGETKALEVFACPTVVGKYSETLVCSLLNNARPFFIEMTCIGLKPDFEFEPKEIRFERVLLNRKEFSELTLSNKCYKPLGWRLVDLPLLSKQVSVSQQSGVIPAMQSASVYINFSASYVEMASHVITIEVFDDQFRGTPFVSEPIPVFLESVDVLVDIMFPQGSDDSELKFQSVKVGEPESKTVVLKNIGKYDVTFSIKFNEDIKLNFKPEQVFTFTPKSGTLPKMEKSVPVKITCMCTKPVHLKKVAVFKVWLVDTGPGAQPVAAIPISVTIEAFSSQYRVIPEPELNFSSMLVGTKKVEQLIVQNIGKFEFMFQILTLEQVQLEKMEQSQRPSKVLPPAKSKSKITQDSGRSSLKTGTEKKIAKGKNKKEDPLQRLTIGAFTLSHSGGVVLPGESFKIDVECFTPSQDSYYEEIVVKVLEYDSIKKKGTHIKLKAVSYLPFINFENVHNIFQEARSQSLPPNSQIEGEPYISYDAESNVLHFYNGCVGSQAVMHLHLHLYNSGLVPCEATATVITPHQPAVFYATPDKFTIMSHSELTVSLAFRPTQIGVFEEVLEVKVELPSPLEPQVFRTQLIGEAFLPRIAVTSPPFPHKLTFPPTLVGECSEETVTFVNNGIINCTVVVEMLTNNNGVLSFYSDNNTLIRGNIHQLHLKKGSSYQLSARFCPEGVGEVEGEVRLMVTSNPYEDRSVALEGVGYTRDIVVDGLPLVRDQHASVGRTSEVRQLTVKYELSLAPCSVGEFAKKVFSLKNQTRDTWYRFQWGDVQTMPITVSPSIGHLPPDSSKELLLVFQSHEPNVVIENEEIGCSLSQIKVTNHELPVGWDNHQKTIKWVETADDTESTMGARRVVVSREEPEYEEVPGSGLSVAVVVSACADYPQVSCPADDVIFPPTIVSQTESYELLLHNTGMVPARYSWVVRHQWQGPGEECARAGYGAVAMSAERPVLQPRLTRRQKVSIRPATCPRVRPGPIPASVALLSQDDLFVRESSSKLELISGWPISVEPAQDIIQPGEQTSCSVRFRPLELASYSCELQLRLEEGEPEQPLVLVRVKGSSVLPCCHLVVPDCCPTSDPQLLQITFRAVGIKKPVDKCVKVVNTTYDDYTFYWREINQEQLSVFGCSKPVGQVSPTKHIEVMFNFTPRATGVYKSTWQLSIPDRQIHQDVLLVGEAVQPYVTLSSTFLQLRPTLIGVRSEGKVVLANHEDCELRFSVDANSLHCGNWGQTVQVQPMRGVLPAQAQIDLRVSLCPSQAGQGHFLVQLAVKRLEAPLKLDVVAQCYLVQPQLVYLDCNKMMLHMQADRDNCIDIGVAEVRIPITLSFTLTNIGKPVFHYRCVWSSEEALKSQLSISVANKTGLVGPQSKQLINVAITPLARTVFSKVKLEIVINKGPRFVMFFNGTAAQPQFRFSMNKYDFGSCFVQKSVVDSYKADLVFTNCDEKPLLVESEFDPKPHLQIGLTQRVVEPRSEVHIPITFLPLACHMYEETLCFLVDGSYRYEVVVTGRGVDLNVMLVDSVDKLVDLEGVVVGRVKRRTVGVVNISEASVTASFSLEPPVPQIRLSPSDPVTIRPHQATELSVTFTPTTVVKGIQQELMLVFQSVRKVLSVVTASSVGVSVKIDRDYLPFGSVAIGNAPTSKLLLSNDGDLAAKFSWQVSEPEFTITPSEGYIAPSTDVVLTVKFSPLRIQPILHAKGVCSFSNGEELVISLSGSCVDLPPPSMTVPLSCPVRTTTTTQLPVFNKFGQEIKLTASVSGEYFSGDSVTLIPPYGTHMAEISYSPLSMTTPSHPHKGMAIFYFVDGTCLVYSLEGSATEPTVSDRLVSQLFTHTPHTLLVPVQNWMQTPQKFRVTHKLQSSSLTQPGCHLTYNEYFMVSGSQTRDLAIKITCHFPGTLVFKVVLTNDDEDYKWYQLTLEVAPCPPLGDLALEGCVRQETLHQVVFHNPSQEPVTVECRVDAPGVAAVNTPLTVQPLQQEAVKLRYLPLWPCEPTTSTLELTCSDLGTFPYNVTTSALPALPLPPLHIRCDFGQSVSKQLSLDNPTDKQATFQCSSSQDDVSVESQVVLGPNESKTVIVSFQPSSLNDVTCDIVASSPEAGEFIFPVVGICNYPEPRGPYTLTPGSSRVVSFRNVYKGKTSFVLSIDNPAFTVKTNKIVLKHNEVTDIKIEMLKIEITEFPNYPVAGKMSVFAEDESLAHIKWVFYLHGELLQT